MLLISSLTLSSASQNHLERTESEILELSQNAINLKSNYLELTELKHVLEKTQTFFHEVRFRGKYKLSPSLRLHFFPKLSSQMGHSEVFLVLRMGETFRLYDLLNRFHLFKGLSDRKWETLKQIKTLQSTRYQFNAHVYHCDLSVHAHDNKYMRSWLEPNSQW